MPNKMNSINLYNKQIPFINWLVVGGAISLFYLLWINFESFGWVIPNQNYSSENKSIKNVESISRTIMDNSVHICKDADWVPYTVKNSYNNFTICSSKNWKIRNIGASGFENYILIADPDNEKLVFGVRSFIYLSNSSTLSQDQKFQFTNVPFSMILEKELKSDNPQFKVDRYTILKETSKLKGVEYFYKIYNSLESAEVVWFVKSAQRNNTYYKFNYEYDSNFDKESIREGKNVLIELIKNFSDAK